MCLARSLDHQNVCPYCRVSLSLHISPTRQAVNVAIASILQKWCKDEYNKRQVEIQEALEEQSVYLPIFVCSIMFPTIACPLHIFEPRYRLMVRSVLESGYNRFGMCIDIDGRGGYAPVGVTAEIRNVRLLPDGRSLIDTIGGRRFKVLDRSIRNGYDVAKVEWLDDIPEDEQIEMLATATPSLDVVRAEVEELIVDRFLPRLMNQFEVESQLGVMPSMRDDPNGLSFWMCAVLPMRLDEKYEYLQLRTLYERLMTLRNVLQELGDKEFC
jgi:Lon protease-like protein